MTGRVTASATVTSWRDRFADAGKAGMDRSLPGPDGTGPAQAVDHALTDRDTITHGTPHRSAQDNRGTRDCETGAGHPRATTHGIA